MTGCWRKWPRPISFSLNLGHDPDFDGKRSYPLLKYPRMSSARKPGGKPTAQRELVVINKLGIHARPAALFVKTANRFTSNVFVTKDGEQINGKSIMGLMMLAAGPGSKLTLHVRGADAQHAIAELEALVKRKFDEE